MQTLKNKNIEISFFFPHFLTFYTPNNVSINQDDTRQINQ